MAMVTLLRKVRAAKQEAWLRVHTQAGMVVEHEVEYLSPSIHFVHPHKTLIAALGEFTAIREAMGETVHDDAICTKAPNSAHYHYKNWSNMFRCPRCGREGRFVLNYLGQRKVVCDGSRFHKVAR